MMPAAMALCLYGGQGAALPNPLGRATHGDRPAMRALYIRRARQATPLLVAQITNSYTAIMTMSVKDQVALLPAEERQKWVESLDDLMLEEVLRDEWWYTGRPEQILDNGHWFVACYLAGRGAGKTRCGSEWLVERAVEFPFDAAGVPTEHVIVGETLSDARMVNLEGPSGIINVLNRRKVPYRYYKAPKPMIVFPSGVKIHTSGADTPDTCRGMNLASALLDEVIKWREPRRTWLEGIMPALRSDISPDHPRAFITTTPKPIDLLRELAGRHDGSVHMIRGSTFDNAAHLSAHVLAELKLRYDGTTLGRQELYGELIESMDGALFSRKYIDANRIDANEVLPDLISIVVGVDPGATGEDDETGIVVVGRSADNHLYVLADSTILGAGRMAAMAVWRSLLAWGADSVVVEDTVGKRWLHQVLQDAYLELRDQQGLFEAHTSPPLVGVDAKIGKRLRAEPVAMRVEQGKVHMVGFFETLENQMVSFDPENSRDSPDRVDAFVYACRHLMKGEKRRMSFADPSQYRLDMPGSFYAVDLGAH